MNQSLNILHLEDNPMDMELVATQLTTHGIDGYIEHVSTETEFTTALNEQSYGLILADYRLPSFDGLQALKIAHHGFPEIPFIFVTGVLGEEQAIESLKCGATDYVLKARLPRLVPAVQRALKEAEERAALKSAEQEKKQALMQLVQMQKLEAIGELAAGIAHEINTPTQYVGDNIHFLHDSLSDILAVLNAYANLLDAVKQDALIDEQMTAAESALKAADLDFLIPEWSSALSQSLDGVARIAHIVGAMKAFSHPDTNEKEPVNINETIDNTITVCRNEWKYVADLTTDFEPSLPLVPCYPQELSQVILNLVVNAAHAIGDVVGGHSGNKGKITISTRQNKRLIEIRIRDTGGGIPEAIRDKIFDPFFTTKEVGKGTGQGLSMAYASIVERHQGKLKVQSEVDKGTTFIIQLPVAPTIVRKGGT